MRAINITTQCLTPSSIFTHYRFPCLVNVSVANGLVTSLALRIFGNSTKIIIIRLSCVNKNMCDPVETLRETIRSFFVRSTPAIRKFICMLCYSCS